MHGWKPTTPLKILKMPENVVGKPFVKKARMVHSLDAHFVDDG